MKPPILSLYVARIMRYAVILPRKCLIIPLIFFYLILVLPKSNFSLYIRILAIVLSLLPVICCSQDSLLNKRIDSFSRSLNPFNSSFIATQGPRFKFDSATNKKLIKAYSPDLAESLTVPDFKNPQASISLKPLVKIGGGFVSYNWDYRSGMDSSVLWNNTSQHLLSASFNAVIAQTLPMRVTYLERRSNSPYFKDFRDIRIDVDVQQYRQLRLQKAMRSLNGYADKLRDPLLPYTLKAAGLKSDQFKNLVNDPGIIKKLLHAKETLIRNDFPDTSAHYRDSAIATAKEFIKFYDTLQIQRGKYEHLADSLKQVFQQSEKKIRQVNQLLSGKPLSVTEIEQLTSLYGKNDKGIQQIRQAYSGLRTMSLGRTLPNYSNLTLQNVNVNGLNLEYARNNIYLAVSAGMVDFRIRDFLYSQQKPVKQYVYAARVGYGTREKDNVILTYFRGRKQLFGGSFQNGSAEIQGISLAGQFFIYKGVKLLGEVAQSGIPYALGGVVSEKPSIRLTDHSQRAYAIGFNSYIPATQTTAEGHFRHSGLNYQSFNSFQYNATANSWAFGLIQLFWKRQLSLQATFRKNDFINPLVLQRYNTNTVYKNLILTFRKINWPVISVGYLPASQYTAVGSQVYENHYQSFTATITHQYKIGLARASSLMMISQFFNDSRDSGLIYYNSKNFFWNQTFIFNLFSASLNLSGMNNGQTHLVVMEEGVSANLFERISAGFAIKINNLNKTTTKVGFNANTRAAIKQIGELNLWMEQSYLPSTQNGLFRYESYNIGLTRYF